MEIQAIRGQIHQFAERFRRRPIRAIIAAGAVLIGDAVWEVCKHRLCGWANARIDKGAGSTIAALRDIAQSAIDHPILSVVGATLVGCGLLVLYFFASVVRSVILERRSRRRAALTAKEADLAALKEWMTASRKEIAQLQQSVSALALRSESLGTQFGRILPSIVGLCEIVSLIREADYCVEKFRFIYDSYPESDVAVRPLDRSWRAQTELTTDEFTESLRLGLEWAEFLERHILRVSTLFGNRNLGTVGSETEMLLRYTQKLNSYKDKNGAACLELLGKHRQHLRDIRDGYAASLTG
jgi:hypothetical protein